MNTGKCPKCETRLGRILAETIAIQDSAMQSWSGVSYLCSNCRTILSVAIDPVALSHDIVKGAASETVQRLHRG